MVKKRQAQLGIEFHTKKSGPRLPGLKRGISTEECERIKAELTALNDKVWNRGKQKTAC
jgi:hypothetical protein